MEAARPIVTFIVRITGGSGRAMTGTVEHVRTSARQRFDGVEMIGPIVAQMAANAARKDGASDGSGEPRWAPGGP